MADYRVVQWSTGGVGKIAVRVLAERPDLELAGVWVHSPEKLGRDAGEIAGGSAICVEVSSDREALLALRPDCICYTASGESRPRECVEDMAMMLSAGINVVTTSIPGLVHPSAFDPVQVERLESACQAGGASLYASGIEPGFAGDELVLTLATLSHRIEVVRTQEIFSYAQYPVAFTLFEVFGFGKPPDQRCIMEMPGIQASSWGPPVRMVADHLGAGLDQIRESYEKRVTDRRIEIAAGVVEAGTVAAVRFETIGVVDGRDAIVIEHVNRIAEDVAPDWPTAARDGTYRIVVDGDPSFTCELTLGTSETFTEQGMIATTMRVVNAIPYVCGAPPGLMSSTDLPRLLPRHAFQKGIG
ncbi:MAG: dihydrodipicolinate reductase [Deltaproteobacteria bacterium]|nr:dihydrodipicolinate reductase [Deltaproteobacteria bacterium]